MAMVRHKMLYNLNKKLDAIDIPRDPQSQLLDKVFNELIPTIQAKNRGWWRR